MASFTLEGKGKWLKIITDGSVSTIATKAIPEIIRYGSDSVQWDTGSMVTCISERLVAELHLERIGITTISGIDNKPRRANTYMVNIMFPNNVSAPYTKVVEAPMLFVDILVGMDVISDLDFHYSVDNGKSKIEIKDCKES